MDGRVSASVWTAGRGRRIWHVQKLLGWEPPDPTSDLFRQSAPVARFNQFERIGCFLSSPLLAMEGIMAGKEISVKKYVAKLSGEEREQLEVLIRKGKGPARRLPADPHRHVCQGRLRFQATHCRDAHADPDEAGAGSARRLRVRAQRYRQPVSCHSRRSKAGATSSPSSTVRARRRGISY
jgi:hypothetical protein